VVFVGIQAKWRWSIGVTGEREPTIVPSENFERGRGSYAFQTLGSPKVGENFGARFLRSKCWRSKGNSNVFIRIDGTFIPNCLKSLFLQNSGYDTADEAEDLVMDFVPSPVVPQSQTRPGTPVETKVMSHQLSASPCLQHPNDEQQGNREAPGQELPGTVSVGVQTDEISPFQVQLKADKRQIELETQKELQNWIRDLQ
jgi:hypothetical protein